MKESRAVSQYRTVYGPERITMAGKIAADLNALYDRRVFEIENVYGFDLEEEDEICGWVGLGDPDEINAIARTEDLDEELTKEKDAWDRWVFCYSDGSSVWLSSAQSVPGDYWEPWQVDDPPRESSS